MWYGDGNPLGPSYTILLWENWNRSSCVPSRRCCSYGGDISTIFLPCGFTENLPWNYLWTSLIFSMIRSSLQLIDWQRKSFFYIRRSICGVALWKRFSISIQLILSNNYGQIVATLGIVKLLFPMGKLFPYKEFSQNRITFVNNVMNLRHICSTEVMARTCYGMKYNVQWAFLGKCAWG